MAAIEPGTYKLTRVDDHLEAVFNMSSLVHPRMKGFNIRMGLEGIANEFMRARVAHMPKKAALFEQAYRDIVESEQTIKDYKALQKRLER